ncbi:hypothetical protein SK128_024004, partial [Halocaridina rubra]
MKMKEFTSKKRYHKGYNPFDEDIKKGKKKRTSGGSSTASSSSGSGRGAGGGIMDFLRRCCDCLCPRPKYPVLANSVVTHRKISR